jgi:hypothetical protein
MTTTPKQALLSLIDTVDESSTWPQLKCMVESLLQPEPGSPLGASRQDSLYSGWKQVLVTMLFISTPILAIYSAYSIQSIGRAAALWHYAAWCLGPPAWFLLEWVWLFDHQGGPTRLAKFQTTIELAQKFWAAVLVLLGFEIFMFYGTRIG